MRFLGDIMLIDLSEILSTEGQVKDYDVISELKEFSFNGNVYVVDNVKDFHLTARNEGKRKASLKGDCVVTLKMLCDRCLDEMELPILTSDKLKVKLGSSFAEEGDIVVVPEEDGYINIAWFLYEFIALNIPMKHVHAPGKCNKGMVGKLSKHLRTSGDDDDDDIAVELPEEEIGNEEPQEIDPRWNELKKILDNN